RGAAHRRAPDAHLAQRHPDPRPDGEAVSMNAHHRHQRGAALLLAMLILTMVATLATGMIWQQWKGIEVQTAEKARSQAVWLIEGATDWARLILRTDLQDREHQNVDTLNEPWNT